MECILQNLEENSNMESGDGDKFVGWNFSDLEVGRWEWGGVGLVAGEKTKNGVILGGEIFTVKT